MRVRMSAKEKRFVSRARVCRVASTDRRATVHTAPLCHAFDPSTRVAYVVTSGLTAQNLRVRRRAAIECDDYFEDWNRLRGVVKQGSAKLLRGGSERSRPRTMQRRNIK